MANKAVYADTAAGRSNYEYNSGSSAPKTLHQEYVPASYIGVMEERSRKRNTKAEPVVRPAERVSPFAVIGMLMVAVMAAASLCIRVQLNDLNNQIVEAGNQLTELQQLEDNLNNEYQQVFDISGIENDMEASGKMVSPNSTQQIYLELAEPDSAETFEATGGFFSKVADALNTAIEFFR